MAKNDFPRIQAPPETRRKMIKIAREFRKEPTPGEKIFWEASRGKKLDGIEFRRQQPIGYFGVDSYNSSQRFLLEVDGPIHDLQKEADAAGQEILEELGPVVLRIKTEVLETNPQLALGMIRETVHYIEHSRSKNTSAPLMGEGQGRG
jgi:very-short-patch-repair endonuclease